MIFFSLLLAGLFLPILLEAFPSVLGISLHIYVELINELAQYLRRTLYRYPEFSHCAALFVLILCLQNLVMFFLPPRLPTLSSQLRENAPSVTPPVCVLTGKFFWALSWNCRAHLLCLPSFKDHFSSLCHAWYLENQFFYVVLVSWLPLCGMVIYFDGKWKSPYLGQNLTVV